MKRLFLLYAFVAATLTAAVADDVKHYGIYIGSRGETQELTSANVGDPNNDKGNTDLTNLEAFKPYITSGKVTFGYKDSLYMCNITSCHTGAYVPQKFNWPYILTLDNATIEAEAGQEAICTELSEIGELVIELKGDNYIRASGVSAMAFYATADGNGKRIRFAGGGTLTVYGDNGCMVFGSDLNAVFDNVTINASISEYMYGIAISGMAKADMYISHSTLDIDGTINGYGIEGFGDVKLLYCDFEEGTEYNTTQKTVCISGKTWKVNHVRVGITPERYGVKVNGVELTEENIEGFSEGGFTGKISLTTDKFPIFEDATIKTLESVGDYKSAGTMYSYVYFKGKNTIENRDADGVALTLNNNYS